MKHLFYLIGTALIVTGIAFATRVEAVNQPSVVQRLPARPSPQAPVLIARSDAFAPLAIPTTARYGSPGGPGPGGPVYPGVAGYSVPNPTGATTGAQLVVLCTVFTGANPQLGFLVGNRVVYGSVGSIVGGYRVAAVSTDSVTFDNGDILEMSDCSQAQFGLPNQAASLDAQQPAPDGQPTITPGAFLPIAPAARPTGQPQINGYIAPPSNGGASGPTVHAPSVSVSNGTGLYGGQTAPMGSTSGLSIYGQSVPYPGTPLSGANQGTSVYGQQPTTPVLQAPTRNP